MASDMSEPFALAAQGTVARSIAVGKESVTSRLIWILCQITTHAIKDESDFTLRDEQVTLRMAGGSNSMQEGASACQTVKNSYRNHPVTASTQCAHIRAAVQRPFG
ncbi:hypothetical protein JCM9957A_12170 [Kineosporia succinea]